jgi:hypothetical protein
MGLLGMYCMGLLRKGPTSAPATYMSATRLEYITHKVHHQKAFSLTGLAGPELLRRSDKYPATGLRAPGNPCVTSLQDNRNGRAPRNRAAIN